MVVAGKVEVQALVGLAFAGNYGAVGAQGVLENGNLEGLPKQIAVTAGEGTEASA